VLYCTIFLCFSCIDIDYKLNFTPYIDYKSQLWVRSPQKLTFHSNQVTTPKFLNRKSSEHGISRIEPLSGRIRPFLALEQEIVRILASLNLMTLSIKIKNSEKEREHQKVQNHLQLEPEFSQLICFMVLNNDIEDNLIKGEAEDQHH